MYVCMQVGRKNNAVKCNFKYSNLVLGTQDCKDIDSNVCQSLRHSGHMDRCQDQEFANVFCPKTCQKCCMYILFTIFAHLKRDNCRFSFCAFFLLLAVMNEILINKILLFFYLDLKGLSNDWLLLNSNVYHDVDSFFFQFSVTTVSFTPKYNNKQTCVTTI